MTSPQRAVTDLDAYLHGQLIGTFHKVDTYRATFTYTPADAGGEEGIRSDLAQPISLGLPCTGKHVNAMAYLAGLLPDNEETLARWGRNFSVDKTDIFGILARTGSDAPGAVQLIEAGGSLPTSTSAAVPLSDRALASLMAGVVSHTGVWALPPGDESDRRGQFSLGGAQKKTALYRSPTGSWALPVGRFPSTHIIKPAISTAYSDSDINEALCLAAMRHLGIRATEETIETIGNVRASVITRFDRITQPDGSVERLHHEDFCQIFGIFPQRKYAAEGGPTAPDIARFIGAVAGSDEQLEFVRQLAFNVYAFATDAHGKNFSLVETPDVIQLAPAYDVASYAPYLPLDEGQPLRRMRLAMPIGGKNRFEAMSVSAWASFARSSGIDEDRVLGIARWVKGNIGEALAAAISELSAADPLVGDVGATLVDAIGHLQQIADEAMRSHGAEPV